MSSCFLVLQCHSMTRLYHGVTKSLNVHNQGINSLFLPLLSLLYICQPDQYHPCSGVWGLQRILSPVDQPEACLQTLQGKISHQVLFVFHTAPPSQFGNKCNINLTNRKRCQECRLAKCYAKVKEDRRCDCHEVFWWNLQGMKEECVQAKPEKTAGLKRKVRS